MSDGLAEQVTDHLRAALGEPAASGSVTFLGTRPLQLLRFGPGTDAIVRYVTVGMSAEPMTGAEAAVADPDAPRAELVLAVDEVCDAVLRPMAVLAAAPTVEGLVHAPGVGVDLGEPLFGRGRCTAVLVDDPVGAVPDLDPGDGRAPVRFLSLLPMTATEAAWKRVHGGAALVERWLAAGTDLRDPDRLPVDLADLA